MNGGFCLFYAEVPGGNFSANATKLLFGTLIFLDKVVFCNSAPFLLPGIGKRSKLDKISPCQIITPSYCKTRAWEQMERKPVTKLVIDKDIKVPNVIFAVIAKKMAFGAWV